MPTGSASKPLPIIKNKSGKDEIHVVNGARDAGDSADVPVVCLATPAKSEEIGKTNGESGDMSFFSNKINEMEANVEKGDGDGPDKTGTKPKRPTRLETFRKKNSDRSLKLLMSDQPVQCNESIKEEGKELFENFVRQEIVNAGLLEPPDVLTPQTTATTADTSNNSTRVSTPDGYKNPLWAKTGKELRQMADAFSKTQERQKLRKKAEKVALDAITYEQFYDMLKELFLDGGMTRERIVVLFFFCADVALRALRVAAVDYFQKFIRWSLRYIQDKVCAWVEAHGGWEVVISEAAKPVFLLSFGLVAGLAIGITLCLYFLRNKPGGKN